MSETQSTGRVFPADLAAMVEKQAAELSLAKRYREVEVKYIVKADGTISANSIDISERYKPLVK